MKLRVPDYYANFKCIADKCTDSCCSGWQVDVDDESYAYYSKLTGDFADKLHSVMFPPRKGNEGQFAIRPDGRCPFLKEDMLCELYENLGEDALCRTCDMYPRYVTDYGNLREMGIALSCVTAAELILRSGTGASFCESEIAEGVSLNNIDASLYYALMLARDKAYRIVTQGPRRIFERLEKLLLFAEGLQLRIRNSEQIKDFVENFDSSLDVPDLSAKIPRAKLIKAYVKYYRSQKIIKPEWPVLLGRLEKLADNDFEELAPLYKEISKQNDSEIVSMAVYFIFRYFMKAVFDNKLLAKVKLCVVSIIMIRLTEIASWADGEDMSAFDARVRNAHLYSREVEHSEENFENLCKLFMKKKEFGIDNIRHILEAL